MAMSIKQEILQSFKPNQAMDDPFLFAGRKRQLADLVMALQAPSSCPVIYGHRGLGKTSTAIQIARIAEGDVSLLEKYNLLDEWRLPPDGYFTTFMISCTDAIVNFDALLQSMINALLAVELISDPLTGKSQLVERTTNRTLSFKFFESSSSAKYQPQMIYQEYQNLNKEEILVRIAAHLTRVSGQPILFIVDEVDRLNPLGLAPFIKANISRDLRFMLVGIGQTLADLISDHASIERIAFPVKIDRMKNSELQDIVTQACGRMNDEGFSITAGREATVRLAAMANGFPWFVHVLGQAALMAAVDDGSFIVGLEHVNTAVNELAVNRFAQQFSDLYQLAVRDSWKREALLRGLALWHDDDVPTGEIYRFLADYPCANLPQYLGHLKTKEYGAVIAPSPVRARGLIRFTNEMFKAYCRIRPSLYNGVGTRVEELWQSVP